MKNDGKTTGNGQTFFTNQDLWRMIAPLFLEQLLVSLVGMADIFIIGFTGEANVSGVSLVNAFNTIFVNLFAALAAGGAVVISQYIGRKEHANAGEAASQLFTASALFSVLVSAVVLLFGEAILHALFGRVEADVMEACLIYLRISALSYPALAIYNAGAALYRSLGKTDAPMRISLMANGINVVGNCIGVFLLHAGVAGVAWPSFIARSFSALFITALCFSGKNPVYYSVPAIACIRPRLQGQILHIAVPNGIESGIFQFVKVALSSVVALFGTYQIAANGVAQSIWTLAALACVTMGPVFLTVIGQCMGAGDHAAAQYYFKKLLRITLCFSALWNALTFMLLPFMLHFYALEEETKRLVILLVLVHNIFNAFALPLADPLGRGLRAAGDVRFTTAVSIFTTVGVRLVFSVLLGIGLGLGVMGIAYAMCLDWIVRGIILYIRFRSGKWKQFRVI